MAHNLPHDVIVMLMMLAQWFDASFQNILTKLHNWFLCLGSIRPRLLLSNVLIENNGRLHFDCHGHLLIDICSNAKKDQKCGNTNKQQRIKRNIYYTAIYLKKYAGFYNQCR